MLAISNRTWLAHGHIVRRHTYHSSKTLTIELKTSLVLNGYFIPSYKIRSRCLQDKKYAKRKNNNPITHNKHDRRITLSSLFCTCEISSRSAKGPGQESTGKFASEERKKIRQRPNSLKDVKRKKENTRRLTVFRYSNRKRRQGLAKRRGQSKKNPTIQIMMSQQTWIRDERKRPNRGISFATLHSVQHEWQTYRSRCVKGRRV